MGVPQNTVYVNGGAAVTDDNLNTFVQVCQNVADARGFIGAGNMQIALEGYISPGDGGQGSFYWNASSTAADDGGISTIVPDGSTQGAWLRLSQNLPASALSVSLPGFQNGAAIDTILFSSVEFDVQDGYSPGSGAFIPKIGGKYLVTALVTVTGTTTGPGGNSVIFINKNGGAARAAQVVPHPLAETNSQLYTAVVSGIIPINGAGDYLQVAMENFNISSIRYGGAAWSTRFDAVWVGG